MHTLCPGPPCREGGEQRCKDEQQGGPRALARHDWDTEEPRWPGASAVLRMSQRYLATCNLVLRVVGHGFSLIATVHCHRIGYTVNNDTCRQELLFIT